VTVGEEWLGLKWDAFLDGGDGWPGWRTRWQPGEHVALIGPTGTGKSTLAVAILKERKYVLALDPKGGDSTLKTLQRAGFERITSWPPPKRIRKAIEEGKPARLIVGPVTHTRADLPRLRALCSQAIDAAFDDEGWTVYCDELQIMADPRMMNLGAGIERNMIAARDKKVSMVGSFQRPARVPRSAADQARWIFLYYTRDIDVVGRLSEMVGRPRHEIKAAVSRLGDLEYACFLFSNNPRDPTIVTRAPKA